MDNPYYNRVYPSIKRKNFTNGENTPNKELLITLTEAANPSQNSYHILEVIGLNVLKSNHIMFFAHFPYFNLKLSQIIDTSFNSVKHDQMHTLHTNMKSFYEPKRDLPRECNYDIGEVVAARSPLDGVWYRAVILNINRMAVKKVYKNVFEVNYIDYGDTEEVDSGDIFMLEPKFCQLPIQLHECCLSNVITPKDLSMHEFSKKFANLVKDQIYASKVDYVSPEGLIYVTLYNISSTGSISFNKILVDEHSCCYSDC